jgi:FolB domain-containing protein
VTGDRVEGDRVEIDDLRVSCIIGIHPWERRSPQEVRITLSMAVDLSPAAASGRLADTIDYAELAAAAESAARRGRYRLLESLAEALAGLCLQRPGVREARVRVRKPAAIRAARAAVVEVVRRRPRPAPRLLGVLNLSPESRVTPSVAAGEARIGERARHLRDAGCELIELGARSTNPAPGAGSLGDAEEIERLQPALRSLSAEGFRVAVETWSADTALWALDTGAVMIDYTSEELPDEVCRRAGERGAALVLVNLPYGDPERMHRRAPIAHGAQRMVAGLSARADAAREAGAGDVYVDPNTGIVHPELDDYRKIELQMQAIEAARRLEETGYPVLINCPRKESLTSRIILSHLLLQARPAWIRTHDPQIIATLRGLGCSDDPG